MRRLTLMIIHNIIMATTTDKIEGPLQFLPDLPPVSLAAKDIDFLTTATVALLPFNLKLQ